MADIIWPLVGFQDFHTDQRSLRLYPALRGGFILATLSDGSVLAHLDHQVRAQVVDQADDVATLQRQWEAVRGEALSRRQSLDLIKEAAQTWT